MNLLFAGYTVLMVGLLMLMVPQSVDAVTKSWVAGEGDTIVNGKQTATGTPNAPGELSIGWQNSGSADRFYTSPDSTTDTKVTHLSQVMLIPDTGSISLAPGDTTDLAVRLINTGNGSDTFNLNGNFVNPAVSWDTNVFLDTNRDSSGIGEPAVDQVSALTAHKTPKGDTGLILRFTLPDTATVGTSESYKFSAQSTRTEDPEPGHDTVILTLDVTSGGGITITSPSDNHDTNAQTIPVRGTSTAEAGDSVQITVNDGDTTTTSVTGAGTWSAGSVPLNDVGDTIRTVLFSGDTGASISDSDVITVNFDAIADTFPQNFTVLETGLDTAALSWSSFNSIPGNDPDTGTGFAEYVVYYDTQATPDSTSLRWDGTDDTKLGSLNADSTIVTGLDFSETYVFRVGYVDRTGNISILSGADTAVTDTPMIPPNLNLLSVKRTTGDSITVANGSGTVGIGVTWENTGTQTGTIQVDTGDMRFVNYAGDTVSGFKTSLMSDTEIQVTGGDTAQAIWSIDVPDTGQTMLQGLSEVYFDTSAKHANLQFSRLVTDVTPSGTGLDVWRTNSQAVNLQGGINNGKLVHDTTVITSSDSVVVMIQRGDSSFIDTPIVNPSYGFTSAQQFESVIATADQSLKANSNKSFYSNDLINISIWKGGVGGTYIGDESKILETATVTIPKPAGSPDNLQVAKLLTATQQWHVIDKDPDITGGKISFDVDSSSTETGAGFSIFRILVGGGISTDGRATETIVYPNPFIPFDGNSETGEYGQGPDEGIFFSAGTDAGFPAGTHLAIYTVAGDRVFEKTTTQGGIIRWNPRTLSGEPVASGVYIYRITTPDGSEQVGKLSIVR